ncbi:MAG: glycosyltransferase family 2 protein [Chitinophagaceae bacterium]
MKISGFTIIRNAILSDYPVVEAITSILPVVDEMIVLVGNSDDATEDLIKQINSPKIKIHYSVWDTQTHQNGTVLAVETNKAFDLIDPESTWAFYIQADEAVHEKYHPAIVAACHKYAADTEVEGLLFNYLHFYGTYDYVGDSRKWYHKEVRIIRNNKQIRSFRDAQGFRVGDRKINVKPIDAYIYHYGWVRSQETMQAKNKHVKDVWHSATDEAATATVEEANNLHFNVNDFDSLTLFTGTHPQVWQQRIANKNWHYELDVTQKKFSLKNRVLHWIEKKTGKRLFDFKNHRII